MPSSVGSSSGSRGKRLTDAELQEIAQVVGKSATDKFGSLRSAFRTLPTSDRGGLSRPTMRIFLAEHGFSRREADQLFDRIDDSGDGEVNVKALASLCIPDRRNRRGVSGYEKDESPKVTRICATPDDDISTTTSGGYAAQDGLSRAMDSVYYRRDGYPKFSGEPADIDDDRCRFPIQKQDERENATRDMQNATRDMEKATRNMQKATRDMEKAAQRTLSRKDLEDAVVACSDPDTIGDEVLRQATREQNSSSNTEKPKGQGRHQFFAPGPLPQPELDRVMESLGLAAAARHKRSTVRAAFLGSFDHSRSFDSFDHSRVPGFSGLFLHRHELINHMYKLGFDSAVADQVWRTLDRDGDGSLTYEEFEKQFDGLITPGMHSPGVERAKPHLSARKQKAASGETMQKVRKIEEDGEMDLVVRKISHMITTRTSQHQSYTKAFRGVTATSSAHVERGDVQLFFRKYGFQKEAAERFFEYLDPEGNGAVPLTEFRSHFCQHINPTDSSCRIWGHSPKDKNIFDGRTTYLGSPASGS